MDYKKTLSPSSSYQIYTLPYLTEVPPFSLCLPNKLQSLRSCFFHGRCQLVRVNEILSDHPLPHSIPV